MSVFQDSSHHDDNAVRKDSGGTGQVGQAASERRGPGLETGTRTAPLLLLANTVHGLLFTRIHKHLLGDVKV